jgi:16S rRNA (cytidine1402-2'-O)-methyltransferase
MVRVSGQGVLVLAATPLGNPGDASARLAEALAQSDVIAAEDTRRVRRLARDLSVSMHGEIISLHDSVEESRIARLMEALHRGARVLVVSDAGMPLVSDPGYRLVRACISDDITVTVLPGPSAVLAALVVSGLPADRFCFEGFLPRRSGERRRRLAELAAEPRTMLFFEAPHRIAATLEDMAAHFGPDRPAALCRELTKTYEEIRRGTVAELSAGIGEPRGEITLVIGGAPERQRTGDESDWAKDVEGLVATGTPPREAISAVADRYGAPRREVYDAVVRAKRGRT